MILPCGCHKETKEENSSPLASQQTSERINLNVQDRKDAYRLQMEDFEESDFALYSQAQREGVAIWGQRYIENIDATEIILNRYEINSNISEDILVLMQNQWISAPCVDDKNMSFVLAEINEDQVSQTIQINNDVMIDLSKYLDEGQEVKWIFNTDDASICLTADGTALAFYFDGSFAWTQQFEFDVIAAFQSENKHIVLITKERTDDAAMIFQELDPQKQMIERICNVPDEIANAHFFSGEKWKYDIMAYDSTYLYGWNFNSSDLIRILKFEDLGIAADYIFTMECLDSNRIIGIYTSQGSDFDQLFKIEKTEQVEQKIEITMSGLTCPIAIKAAIADFNRMYPEYFLKYIDYSEQYGEEAVNQLNIDMITGNTPDLILGNGIDYRAYAEKGILENLYLMIDQDDDFSREDFLPNLLESVELGGKLYYLPQSFSIAGVTGLREFFGTETSCAVSDLLSLKQQLGEDTTFFPHQTREQLVSDILLHGYKNFIDSDTYKANFNSEEFEDILELIYHVDEKKSQEYENDNELSAQMNKKSLLRRTLITSADQFDKMMLETNDEIVCMGYPGTNTPVFYLNNPVVITSNSPNKDVAWKFLKLLVTSTQYIQGRGWLPLIGEIESALQEDLTNGVRDTTIAYLKDIIWSMDQTAYYNKNIIDIIWSELQPYFNNQQTKEDTAKLINDRVQLYLDEVKSK